MSSDDKIIGPWSLTAFVEMNEDFFFNERAESLSPDLNAKKRTRLLTLNSDNFI
jgi:hypothetical protein